jgi:hypothetical protein
MLCQRIFGIAAGYEDCNDAGSLRYDAVHQLAIGCEPSAGHLLASQPTLSRFETSATNVSNELMQQGLVYLFAKAHKRKLKVIRLSMDTTHDPVHGYQQLSCFNGYYGMNCFAPLFIFSDDGFPLSAVLRPGSPNPAEDALRILKKLQKDLRKYFPNVRLELKADAAFADPELFEFCEQNNITYFIATRSHAGLAYHAQELIEKCKREFDSFGEKSPELKKYAALPQQNETLSKKAKRLIARQKEERIRFSSKEEGRMQEHFEDELHVRKYGEFVYQSKEWSKERRFIFRVDFTKDGPDTRFVITNASGSSA